MGDVEYLLAVPRRFRALGGRGRNSSPSTAVQSKTNLINLIRV